MQCSRRLACRFSGAGYKVRHCLPSESPASCGHGKRRAGESALIPSTGALRPCPEESVDRDTSQNVIIEGDNLEVLKALQESYAGNV